jgi:hypothetical protein
MKNILIILLFIPLVCFGQDDINLNLKTQSLNDGDSSALAFSIKYLNNGVYEHSKKAPTDLWSSKRTIRKTIEDIQSFSKGMGMEYKILSTQKSKIRERGSIGIPFVKISFNLLDSDGNTYISKKERKKQAKKEILELKGFLDLGIITQEEFDKTAVALKKILIGN